METLIERRYLQLEITKIGIQYPSTSIPWLESRLRVCDKN